MWMFVKLQELITRFCRIDLRHAYLRIWLLVSGSLLVSFQLMTMLSLYVLYLGGTEAPVQSYALVVSLLCAGFMLVLIGGAFVSAQRVEETYRIMEQALADLREGDLSVRIAFPETEQLGELEDAFNSTFAVLQSRLENNVAKALP